MPVDWSTKGGSFGDHSHFPDQIVDPNTALATGTGVNVTDGMTSVAASSIQMPAGTVSDLGSGVASVALILQQVGPISIAFGTAGLTGDGAVVAAIPAGSILIDNRVVVTTKWDDGGGDYTDTVQFLWAPSSDLTDSTTIGQLAGSIGASAPADLGRTSVSMDFSPSSNWGLANGEEFTLLIWMQTAAIAGAFDIYAIIATPAA